MRFFPYKLTHKDKILLSLKYEELFENLYIMPSWFNFVRCLTQLLIYPTNWIQGGIILNCWFISYKDITQEKRMKYKIVKTKSSFKLVMKTWKDRNFKK